MRQTRLVSITGLAREIASCVFQPRGIPYKTRTMAYRCSKGWNHAADPVL